MKKKLLIISAYYPPIQSIASNRIASFVKYLDKNIFEIDVITFKTIDTVAIEKHDGVTIYRLSQSPYESYLKITRDTNIFFRKLKALYNRLAHNSLLYKWRKETEKKAFQLHQDKSYDIVLSSYSPEDTHRIALTLKMKYPELKWVADMRDEMSLNPFISSKKRVILQVLEEQVFRYCDAITSVSKPILDDFKKLARVNECRILFKEIRNGYDFEINYNRKVNDVFTISYVGTFYGQRNPQTFLKALEILVLEGEIPKFHLRLVGNLGMLNIPAVLEKFVTIEGYLEHKKALQIMKNSDILLLIHPNNGRKGVYTGKLFEYLAMNQCILALVDTKDVAAELIKKSNSGICVEPENIEKIKESIMLVYKKWENNDIFNVNFSEVKKHHRKEQAMRLQNLFEQILNKGKS